MATTISSNQNPISNKIKKLLLYCGIVSSLIYVAVLIYLPMQYQGYSSESQTISELAAIGSPTIELWYALSLIYCLLIVAFGYGIYLTAKASRPLQMVAMLMVVLGICSFLLPPMQRRECLAIEGISFTDSLHAMMSFLIGILMLLTIVFGAVSFGKYFRYFSIATAFILLVFACMTVLTIPRIVSNMPTPRVGIWERISFGVYLIWIIVLTILLLLKGDNRENFPDSAKHGLQMWS